MRMIISMLLVAVACSAASPLPVEPEAVSERSNAEWAQFVRERIEGKEELPASDVFDNVTVMRSIPAGRLVSIMENGFSPALGVQCDFCHQVPDFASDADDQKKNARDMWRMTGDIREMIAAIVEEEGTFVNCYTCHRGQEEPATSP